MLEPTSSAGRVEQIVHDAAKRWPHRVALYDDRGPLTYAMLLDKVRALSAALRAQGVAEGMALAIRFANGRDFVVSLFAGLQAGAVIMPIAADLPMAAAREQAREAGMHALLDVQDGDAKLAGFSYGFSWICPRELAFAPHIQDKAFVRFTSGTTGKSKGVVVGHRAALARGEAAQQALALNDSDVVLWVLPMAYHFIVSLVTFLRFGIAIAVCKSPWASDILDAANTHHGTVLYAAPMHLRLLAYDQVVCKMPTLRLAIGTSGATPAEVCTAFQAKYGVPVREVYGIIEIGLPCGDLMSTASTGGIGVALPGCQVSVVDDDGNPVDDGVTGHLVMRGPGLFDGYLSPPQTRDEILREGWFWTGDLGRRDSSGSYHVVGRTKSMINIAGLKVFPERVESVLNAHPDVEMCRVFGRDHSQFGEVVVAHVMARTGALPTRQQLRRWCRTQLPAYQVPTEIEFVTEIEMTATGKVQRW